MNSQTSSFFSEGSAISNFNSSTHKVKGELYNPFKSSNEQERIMYEAARSNFDERQVQKYRTPLYQKTNIVNDQEREFKPTVKSTQFSNQKSLIFDLTDERKGKEYSFKPSVIKVPEPGQNSHFEPKQQLKTSELPSRANLYRNPIIDGDPKSNYVKNPTVRPENMPKNQIFFG